jgi:hypothetical protein
MKIFFFLFAVALLFDEKIRQSAAQTVFRIVWETTNHHLNIKLYMVPALSGDRFEEKVAGSSTYKPSSEEFGY